MDPILHQYLHSNLPLNQIAAYREIGYIEEVLLELIKYSVDLLHEYEWWLLFRLNHHRGELTIPPSKKKQIVFIVGDESTYIPEKVVDQAYLVFKQYLGDDCKLPNLFHLPVGPSKASVETSPQSIPDKKYNVFFSGNLHLGRAELFRAFNASGYLPFFILHRMQKLLNRKYDNYFPNSFIRFYSGFHKGISPLEYSDLLYASKIAICPYGLINKETMRHFEAMRSGSIIITKPMPTHECYVGAPFQIVNHWSELRSIVNKLLLDEQLLETYSEQTLAWWHQKCSSKAVAKSILKKIS